jgi:hypothetical protein
MRGGTKRVAADIVHNKKVAKKSEDFFFKLMGIK